MTLSMQEISDRFEIQDLCWQYAHIIDSKQFDELRNIFSEDAHIDYSVFGGPVGKPEEIITFLKEAFTMFPHSQHLNANMQITVDGDRASGRIMCLNPQQMSLDKNESVTFLLGLWYVDEYLRTAQGWRITRRVEEKSWSFNTPDFMNL